MSKQRAILPEVLSFVRRHVPDCPVYLSGSVALQHERPDSDIDLFIVVPDVAAPDFPGGVVEWQDDRFKLVKAVFRSVPLHLHFGSPALLEMLEAHPWRSYKFLQMVRLRDPNGTVPQTMDRIARWFDEHPDAVKLWQQWLVEHQTRQLTRGEELGPLVSQFPNQVPDFWNHLDEVFGGQSAELPEHTKPCGPRERGRDDGDPTSRAG